MKLNISADHVDHKPEHADKKYDCDSCNESFKDSSELKHHKEEHTGEIYPTVCP